MQKGFWADLPKPFFGLSPMDGVTDQPYRALHKRYGRPDILVTEFTSAEGIAHNATPLLRDFRYEEEQRPIVGQIFGKDPAAFRTAALVLCYLGFDGIDINMGCPAKTVSQHGSGAALIRTPHLAQELIRATRAGINDWVNGKTLDDCPELKDKLKQPVLERFNVLGSEQQQRQEIPVSVKTRIGFETECVVDWMPYLLEMEPVNLSIHGRTLKQMYSGTANWEAIAKVVELAKGSETLVTGNGDVSTVDEAFSRISETGVDGILIGRATYGNPWIFQALRARRDGEPEPVAPTTADRMQLAIEHAELYEATYPGEGFLPMRKHLSWYIKNFPDASNYRVQLVLANNAAEVKAILQPLIERESLAPAA